MVQATLELEVGVNVGAGKPPLCRIEKRAAVRFIRGVPRR